MFKEIFDAMLAIIRRTPLDNLATWLIWGAFSDNTEIDRRAWKKSFEFIMFIALISAVYFLITADWKNFFITVGVIFIVSANTANTDEDGESYYPLWKRIVISIELLLLVSVTIKILADNGAFAN